MKEKIVEVQGIEVKMMKMPAVSALSLWDDLVAMTKASIKEIKLQLDSPDIQGLLSASIDASQVVSALLTILGSGNLSKIISSSIKHIHISDKNISSLDQLTARLESLDPEIDTLSFIDDFIIELIRYQYEKKIMNLMSQVNLAMDNPKLKDLRQSKPTGESGE